jgi:hypothetical protein
MARVKEAPDAGGVHPAGVGVDEEKTDAQRFRVCMSKLGKVCHPVWTVSTAEHARLQARTQVSKRPE